jgi:ERCC4-type nuclease
MNFTIVADTREQQPYSFPCATNRKALAAGDYSVEGLEERVAVERKSLPDFVHTVIHDHARFGREMLLLSTYDAACVVVEADLDSVLRGFRTDDLRGASPESVLGAALHITLRYGVPVFWCGSRQAARAFTEMYLRMAARTKEGRV